MNKNTDPFAPWNNPINNSPLAPHNSFDSDNPFKPWNEPFGSVEDLTDSEKDYYGIKRNTYNNDYDY